ncbi:DUF6809 family protein [Anaerotignum sp.]
MSILEDYYNGVLIPIENFGNNEFSGYQDLSERVQEREKELLETLSKDQINLYKKIKNDRSDMLHLELERMFVYAFRMGFFFTADLYSE